MEYTNKYDEWYKVAYMLSNLAELTGPYRVNRLVRIQGVWIVKVTY